MKLYNTVSRSVEEFKPSHPPTVNIYTCGPTVYDYPHIGNWFTFIRYDILIRALKSVGFKPYWVMNITDVGHLTSDADEGQDKLERGAQREGKSAWDVAEFYGSYFVKGLGRLNISHPNEMPRATEHIQEQIDLIKDLENRGYTYTTRDGVYYDTSKFASYGKMARLDIKNLQAGARVEANPHKRNPTDFALWKLSPVGHKRDMEWPSPWGIGFPGWHVECSAMAMKYLGQTLDIHSGGIDHIPIHHTNEIAQSEAVTGQPLARFWVHMNHIMIKGEKLAKSTGNGITLEDIEKKGVSLEALRVLVLESNYRTQAEFSWETLEAAQNRLDGYKAMADLRWQLIDKDTPRPTHFDFEKHIKMLAGDLQNNLDTPHALSNLSIFSQDLTDRLVHSSQKESFNNFLRVIDLVLGLQLAGTPDISQKQKQIIAAREKARASKDWATSDKLREELEKQKIGLRDTHSGPIWYRL